MDVHSKFKLVAPLLCYRVGNTGAWGGHDPTIFCVAKRKKRKQRKKRKSFKAKTIRRLSLMPK